MKIKKLLSALLLMSILTASLISCGNSDTTGVTDTSGSDTEETTTAAETDYVKDVLPDNDYNGYNFRMLIRNDDAFVNEMYIEEADGDIINDAVYERNMAVAEKFNIKFEMFRSQKNDALGMENVILAGEDAYDLLAAHARYAFIYAHGGLVIDWNTDMPHVDLSQLWWNQDAIKEFAFNDKLYVMVGDISYLDFGAANGMLFNKQLLNNYSLESPYDLVKDDKWTFDKFSEMAKTAILDLNGDSVISYTDDRLGYLTGRWIGPIQLLYSAGQRICRMEDGIMTLSINTPQTATAYEKFFNLATSEGMYIYESDSNPDITKPFIEGRVLFNDMNIKNTSLLRDMEDDFGIVPWPKMDETVEDYYSNVDAGCSAFTVPITSPDTERTSLILEALCYLGYRDVIPTYYEVVLTTKYARDEDSIAMLDIINRGRVFDIGYYYHEKNIGNINSMGCIMVKNKNFNFASMFASLETPTLEKIEQINEIYAD